MEFLALLEIGTARSPEEAGDLAATGAVVLPLDVTDIASVEALAQQLNGAGIDVLINNAGILGHRTGNLELLAIDQLLDTFDVNALGPLRVIKALLPNLRESSGKTVVNISSNFGSIELAEESNANCCLGYSASKAALNNLNMNLSKSYRQEGLVFVVLHPGRVNTAIAGPERSGILPRGMMSPDESAAGLFAVITSLKPTDTGAFIDWQGNRLPW